MRRSLLRYTHVLLLPLLAVGLVLTGCDSSGSNGDDGPESTIDEPYPDPSDGAGYAKETAINLQLAGLGIRLEGDSPSSTTLNAIYNGSVGGNTPIQRISSVNNTSAGTYGELDMVADIKTEIQNFNDPILKSEELEQGVDAPNTSGPKTADELISFYLGEAKQSSANGVAFNQFAEKGVASALGYADAADILNKFEAGTLTSEDKWNEAFGHFGAPHSFGEFFDVTASGAAGLPDGSFKNADGGPDVDLYSEGVYIWAGYAAERAAAAEATGNPNNFAARAFNAFVDGRQAIDEGNTPDAADAREALQAWEETVAVNVIHYINGLEERLEGLDDSKTISQNADDDSTPSDIDEGAWGEAKAFLWALQFESQLTESDLESIHDLLGAAPPYGDKVGDYEEDLQEATEIIADSDVNPDAYDFASENVEKW